MIRLEAEIFDLRGLKCPLPALRTKKRLALLPKGALLTLETTDPLAVIDIPHLCGEGGHDLLESAQTKDGHRFTIRKG
jgi:tRNA 2-thiouridine synthesizing protein A